MLKQLQEFINELRDRPMVVIYHSPDQPMPMLDFSVSGTIKFVPHKAVPEGQAWVVNNGPSGRILTED